MLLSRTDGLIAWQEATGGPEVSNGGVSVTVLSDPALPSFNCSDAGQFAITVRSDRTWRRLWPPVDPQVVPANYEKRLAPARAMIQRMVEK